MLWIESRRTTKQNLTPRMSTAEIHSDERSFRTPFGSSLADRFSHLSQNKRGSTQMAAEGYHEPYEQLTAGTRDMHRALRSLMEELEAVDWYNQRVDVCHDDELKAILAHNRDEEKEHAAMVLEWIRRHDPILEENLDKYL